MATDRRRHEESEERRRADERHRLRRQERELQHQLQRDLHSRPREETFNVPRSTLETIGSDLAIAIQANSEQTTDKLPWSAPSLESARF